MVSVTSLPRKDAVSTLRGVGLGQMIERTVDLPTMPTVAMRVMSLADSTHADVRKLAALIEVDQGIAGRILRIANSSLFRRQREISSVIQAISMLGLRELKNLVVGIAARTLYRGTGKEEQRLWEHSVAVGLGALIIARRWAPELRGAAFLAGQMHDVGRIVLRNQDRQSAAEAEKRGQLVGLANAERSLLGFSHADIGAVLMNRWNLPEGVEWSALCHHDGDFAVLAGDHARLVATVILADHVADAAKIGTVEGAQDEELLAEAAGTLGLELEELAEVQEELMRTYQQERTSLFH